MTTLTRRYRFCASHRLHSKVLSDAENGRTYGKCNNPYGHGHDYLLDVSVTGELNATTGLVVPLTELDRLVSTEVLERFSYRNLNVDLAEFDTIVPTTENVALVIGDLLQEKWSHRFPYSSARLSAISVQETDRNSFLVTLPKAIPNRKLAPLEANESVIVNA